MNNNILLISLKDILRRNKKSLKLSLKLLIKTGSANLMTNLRNDLTNKAFSHLVTIIDNIVPPITN